MESKGFHITGKEDARITGRGGALAPDIKNMYS